MTWIGGIHTKLPMQPSEVKKQADLMIEIATPKKRRSSAAGLHSTSPILREDDRRVLIQIPLSNKKGMAQRFCQSKQGKVTILCAGCLYNHDNPLSEAFENVPEIAKDVSTERLLRLVTNSSDALEQRLKEVIVQIDGDYALAISDTDKTVISRNALGTKPLYFGENGNFSAFASNKKPLWRIGLDEVMPLRAGTLAIFDGGKIGVETALPLEQKETEIRSMTRAVNSYQEALYKAIRKRLDGLGQTNKVGVLLSGGVDSCLIAKLLYDAVLRAGGEVIAYTVGLPDSPDVSFAYKFATEFRIKHKTKILTIEGIEKYIPDVIEAIEDSDFVQVEAGIGIYAAIEMAAEDGIELIFSGQGPDELWGGYNWYPKVLAKDGRQELCHRMWEDFTRADVETLDRENKIAMAHSVGISFPYLDYEVVNLAWTVASELKVISDTDCLGKHPHRLLAMKLGIPKQYANREKLAIQHGTGIHSVLDKIARKNGFDVDLVNQISYRNEEITSEKMGSSSRYGYRYDGEKLWQVPPHVQFFLHALAYDKGVLNKSVRNRVEYFLEKAGLI